MRKCGRIWGRENRKFNLEARMKLEYGSIGKSLVFRAELKDLTMREQAELFSQLMNNLGITEKLDRTEDAHFLQVWDDAANDAWEAS